VCSCNPSYSVGYGGRIVQAPEFKTSLCNTARPCLFKKKNKEERERMRKNPKEIKAIKRKKSLPFSHLNRRRNCFLFLRGELEFELRASLFQSRNSTT
jgi:hypothetical protein